MVEEKLGDGSFLRLLDDILELNEKQDEIIQHLGEVIKRQDAIIEMLGCEVDRAERTRREELRKLIADYEKMKGTYV